MAYLVRRPGGSVQIRESLRTAAGPRSRTLASFRGALSEDVLEQAAHRAGRPFDRAALIARARAMGLGWESSADSAARRLVRGLRGPRTLDPVLVGLLRERLSGLAQAELPDELDAAAEWLGSSDAERGATLRELLRLGDAIVSARDARSPRRRAEPYPQIHSGHDRAA